jgi:hypothetical protein
VALDMNIDESLAAATSKNEMCAAAWLWTLLHPHRCDATVEELPKQAVGCFSDVRFWPKADVEAQSRFEARALGLDCRASHSRELGR